MTPSKEELKQFIDKLTTEQFTNMNTLVDQVHRFMTYKKGENPFSQFYTEKYTPKVFDEPVASNYEFECAGLARILVLVPKKGQPLENMPFSVSWCHPTDTMNGKWSRKVANKIIAGRMNAFLENATYSVRKPSCCGVVLKAETIGDIPTTVLQTVKMPSWAGPKFINCSILKH